MLDFALICSLHTIIGIRTNNLSSFATVDKVAAITLKTHKTFSALFSEKSSRMSGTKSLKVT